MARANQTLTAQPKSVVLLFIVRPLSHHISPSRDGGFLLVSSPLGSNDFMSTESASYPNHGGSDFSRRVPGWAAFLVVSFLVIASLPTGLCSKATTPSAQSKAPAREVRGAFWQSWTATASTSLARVDLLAGSVGAVSISSSVLFEEMSLPCASLPFARPLLCVHIAPSVC